MSSAPSKSDIERTEPKIGREVIIKGMNCRGRIVAARDDTWIVRITDRFWKEQDLIVTSDKMMVVSN